MVDRTLEHPGGAHSDVRNLCENRDDNHHYCDSALRSDAVSGPSHCTIDQGPRHYAKAWLKVGGHMFQEPPGATVEDLRNQLAQFRGYLSCMAEEMERGQTPRSAQQLSFLNETLVDLDEARERAASLEQALRDASLRRRGPRRRTIAVGHSQ